MMSTLLALSCLAATADGSSSGAAFVFSSVHHPRHSSSSSSWSHQHQPPQLHMVPPPSTSRKQQATLSEIEAESEQLRAEIKELRAEAIRRLDELNEKLTADSILPSGGRVISGDELRSGTSSIKTSADNPEINDPNLLPPLAPIVFTETKSKDAATVIKKMPRKGIANLLDGTRWKISLSIGREPGTWMPNEWGKSGQRLNLSFTAEFTPSQLFDRDDFLRGGYANAKIFHVLDNEIRLGPSISEGERKYRVKDGGWQVTRGDGPLGTDLLRFFIEVDERIEHTGGDVHVPRGRVYSSCGYFPFLNNGDNGSSVKDAFTKELDDIEEQIMKLQKAKEEIKNPFNLEGIKISREIFKLNRDAEQVANKLNFMAVKEPDRSLLRFSKDEDVGLTKEGGVCCQVNKGPVVEYHILGRFSIAAVDKD